MHSAEGKVVAAFWCTSLSVLLNWVYYILKYAWLVFWEGNTTAHSNVLGSITWIQFIECWAKCCRGCRREATIVLEFDRELALTVTHIVLVEIVVKIIARVLGVKDLVLGHTVLTSFVLRDHLL